MSVQKLGPYRMPQPEQWLSEHPGVQVFLALTFIGALVAWLVLYG